MQTKANTKEVSIKDSFFVHPVNYGLNYFSKNLRTLNQLKEVLESITYKFWTCCKSKFKRLSQQCIVFFIQVVSNTIFSSTYVQTMGWAYSVTFSIITYSFVVLKPKAKAFSNRPYTLYYVYIVMSLYFKILLRNYTLFTINLVVLVWQCRSQSKCFLNNKTQNKISFLSTIFLKSRIL